MKKKGNLDAIDPYLMIGIEGMLLCEYSEEQILSHIRQILKNDYPQKGRKALLADLREASRIREAIPPEECPLSCLTFCGHPAGPGSRARDTRSNRKTACECQQSRSGKDRFCCPKQNEGSEG